MISPDLPLIDLHRHLEGCVRPQTILDLARQHNLALPAWNLDDLRPHIQVTTPQPGVMAFIEKFKWCTGVMVDTAAVQRIAYENIEDIRAGGIHYAELRFSPLFMAQPHGLHPNAVVEAVIDGVTAASRATGTPVKLIGILSRTYGPQAAWKELLALLAYRQHIIALDLAGDEVNFPGELFVDHIEMARDAGWHITVHAGESVGPHSIWQALDGLGAERVGHAVHAPEDPTLMDALRDRRIGIEANLTSNVQTSTVPDYPSHPIRAFLQYGLLATLNTDDPAISGIDLAYEYKIAAPAAGLTSQQIRQCQRNALQAAFLTDEEKKALEATLAGQ
jgi:adenosine deaminase